VHEAFVVEGDVTSHIQEIHPVGASDRGARHEKELETVERRGERGEGEGKGEGRGRGYSKSQCLHDQRHLS
jgi:hypothetical protein